MHTDVEVNTSGLVEFVVDEVISTFLKAITGQNPLSYLGRLHMCH